MARSRRFEFTLGDIRKVETLEELQETLAENEKVVVVFSAVDWCVPCQRLAPHAKAAAEQLGDYLFLDVDVDHVDGVKETFGIMSVPQVWYYEDLKGGLLGRAIKARTALQLVRELQA
jgi:thioredoxin-like negative regulator of GroEL